MRIHQESQKKSSAQNTKSPTFNPLESRPFAVHRKPEETEETERSPETKGYESAMPELAILNPEGGRAMPVQPKLAIGAPGDKYEQEADRVASQVVKQLNSPDAAKSSQGQSLQRMEAPVEELPAKPRISDLQRSPLPLVQREVMRQGEYLQAKSNLQRGSALGEASRDLESAINSARGSGQPLDVGLQRLMGQAMGADFSGVKVHTDAQSDQLNQSIQAKAFTTGQDIFFRQGTYDPGSRGGQELIAHELTHVVQQNGGAVQRQSALEEQDNLGDGRNSVSPSTINGGSVLQRAVGFEFECNWQVNKVGKRGDLQTFPKKTLLHQGVGWTMETDGTDIEFVVDHIDEGADGRLQLENVMQSLTQWAAQMNQQKAAGQIDDPNFVTVRRKEGTRVNTQNEDIKANPQSTGGFRLERLETLYRSLASQPVMGPANQGESPPPDLIPEATEVLGGQSPGFYATRSQNSVRAINAVKGVELWPGHPASDKLAGLVGLICQYLDFGKGTAQLQTAKYMTWIMGRTDFGAMLLSTPEADYLREHPRVWEDLVLTTAMTAVSGALPGENAVIERPISDAGTLAGNKRIQIPITRHKWLKEMTKGKDLLTEHAQKIHLYSPPDHKKKYRDTRTDLGHRLRGLGGLGKRRDTTSGGHRAEIVEFRSMKTQVPYTDWHSLALRVFDFIVAVNAAETSSETVNMQE